MSLARHKWWQMLCQEKRQISKGLRPEFQIRLLTEQLQQMDTEVGQPKKIISDNGPQCRSVKWKTLTSILGIELGFTAVYHPAANPVERVMRELVRLFRMYCNEHHSHWAVIVNDVERLKQLLA
ncbi:hypothetical protein PR048_003111 [Dryococelus australis]|uniref:Integrase catalytic domain-containing protein n=1 Tax=Dryococelus australis TaxID=614101 RepID=A0ABQ9IM76_9NEOP|nr:hypothetical protein PR048_003111 [Dryococelus australis]